MTLEERIEANANRVLWCVHVIGPDDVYAQPSHAAAVVKADEFNRALWSRPDAHDDICCFAYADPWPWSAEAHASDIKRQADFLADAKARQEGRNLDGSERRETRER